ncbi:MAG: Maf family protein [Nitrospirota bacterium]
MPLILASTSPRRAELLSLLQVPFKVEPPSFQEHVRLGVRAEAMAKEFARGKAQACAVRFSDSLVLGCDTLIDLDGAVLGKPVDLPEARAMLRRLSGREHVIHTAVACRRLCDGVDEVVETSVRVWMRNFGAEEIERYLDTGESLGKAGAYSIQGEGSRLIAEISGDYTAAVGLPLRLVADRLGAYGVEVPVDVEILYRTKPYPNWGRFAD